MANRKFEKGNIVISHGRRYRVEEALMTLEGQVTLLICTDQETGAFVHLDPANCILARATSKSNNEFRITL